MPPQIQGPSWLATDRYRVQIETTSSATREQMMEMMQPVVTKAFGLAFHMEVKPSPVYRLQIKNRVKFGKAASSGIQSQVGFAAGTREFTSVGQLATFLNSLYYDGGLGGVNHPVVDGTGAAGQGAFSLSLGDATDLSSVRFLELVKTQLGLDLVVIPGHTQYLVVDRIQKLLGLSTSP